MEDDFRTIIVYISQPMQGKTIENRLAEFERVKAQFKDEKNLKHEFRCNALTDTPDDAHAETNPLFYLGASILQMDHADIVYFCADWQHSNECIIEHECAVRFGKTLMYD